MSDGDRAAVPTAAEVGGPLSFLPKPIREARRPLVAILAGWLTAFLPSIALAFAVQGLLPDVAKPALAIDGVQAVLLVAVFAPVVETLIMAALLSLMLLFARPAVAVLASSIGWGVAHSLVAPAWGLVIWWPFLVFSTLFVTWRGRSWLAALAIPATVHGLQNLLPALLIAGGFDSSL